MAQVLVSGMILGGIYALIALGFCLTWRTTRTLSFAQGELVTLGALLGLALNVDMGVAYPVAVVLTIATGAVLSVLIQQVAIRPFAVHGERGVMAWVLGTVAVSILLRNAYELIWGLEPRRWLSPFGEELIQLGPIALLPQQIAIVAALAVLALLTSWVFGKTLWGKAFNAVAQHADAAALSGISPRLFSLLAYAISGGLAACAGVMLAPVTLASAHMGFMLVVSAFTVAVLTGLMSLRGVLLVGPLFGAFEALVSRYIGSNVQIIAGLLVIILALMLRPNGLFGRRQVVKV